jgi:subtilisin family serine protease
MGDAGILNVFAAGNGGSNNDTTPFYPASYTSPSVIAVAASDSNDNKASFSQFGAISVDLAAPGVSILSTVPTGYSSSFSGTSMAAPHVTGAVALLSAYRPDLSVASLKASVLNNVDVLPAWNGLVKTGGRLNVFKAMQTPTVCNFNPAGTTMNIPTRGGFYTINIAAGTNCDYFVKADTPWIRMISNAGLFSDTATFSFRVGVNPTISRTGTITIGGQTLTIRQSRN